MTLYQIFFLTAGSLLIGCKGEDILTSCSSKPTEVISQQLVKAQGTVKQYGSSDQFYIKLNKCSDCRTIRPNPPGLSAPANPCNLPESFQKDGLSIDFSGIVRIDTTLNYSAIDISGIPLQLTSIKLR
ncbi:hypothetical protein Slin_7023 (plasmid) [Spirosoma linguale DSM 74]|uniref:Uncharacterized protein n=1 Tax=Spirosoma linguale (strain ATCC 33905 / DSM 74 / LMG 10896 / Claus 1) TaxID=504472 RepID=D2QVY4_SPILD|nr:hypothetical protein Slin_7023 [Spirosoma linguale DSM 74]